MLRMLAAGVSHPSAFPMLTPIPAPAVSRALTLLHQLGFTTPSEGTAGGWALTADGKLAAGLQLEPRQARFLLTASKLGCGLDAVHAIALMQVGESIFQSCVCAN